MPRHFTCSTRSWWHVWQSPATLRTRPSSGAHSAGGGGWGSPLERDPQRVLADVLDGLVTLESAQADYGVRIDPESMTIDMTATQACRQDMQAKQAN